MKNLISLFLLLVCISSCTFQMEKRRYMKGYHISISSNKKGKSVNGVSLKSVARLPEKLYVQNTSRLSNTVVKKASQPASNNLLLIDHKSTTNIEVVASSITKHHSTKVEDPTNSSRNNFIKTRQENEQPVKSDGLFLMLSGMLASFTAFAFKPLLSKSRKVGMWALNNRNATRAIHFGLHSVLAISGLYLGANLFRAGVASTDVSTYSLAILGSSLLMLYPYRKTKTGFFKSTYNKQKWFALASSITGLLLFINLGNRYASEKYLDKTYASISVTDSKIIHHGVDAMASVTSSPEKGMSDSDRTALSVLLIVLCVLVCIAMAALSCALFCSGQGALGALVIIVGIPLVIVGTVHLVRNLLEPVRAKKRVAIPNAG